MISELEFLEELQTAISEKRITLPTLPEVALRVRDAVEQENSTAHEIADMVGTDAALSTRLLQVANSPLYRGRVPIESIQMAVTRLGMKLVRSLVVSLAMKQIFQATSDVLDSRLRAIWEKSVEIAARLVREVKDVCQGVHIMPLGWEKQVPAVLDAAGL